MLFLVFLCFFFAFLCFFMLCLGKPTQTYMNHVLFNKIDDFNFGWLGWLAGWLGG
jgi:hypothetical protein